MFYSISKTIIIARTIIIKINLCRYLHNKLGLERMTRQQPLNTILGISHRDLR